MKKRNVLTIAMFAGLLAFSSCASKKDLVNCQNENRELTSNYQTAKEDLAASKARVAALEARRCPSRPIRSGTLPLPGRTAPATLSRWRTRTPLP